MRIRLAACTALLAAVSVAQNAKPPVIGSDAQTAAVTASMLGHWVGFLEYRDYSEPPASSKRVQLPTWLYIRPAPEGTLFDYTFDDGPAKVLHDHSTLVLNIPAATVRFIGTDSPIEDFTIVDSSKLKDGRGEITLTGVVKDNNKPADLRRVMMIHRNLIAWTDEVRPQNTTEPFAFRHRYVFVRAEPPPDTSASQK
jgi:hypothetical protein